MGVGRRLLDLARANLNALMDRAAKSELDVASEDDLRKELERRQQERSEQEAERQRRVAAEAAAKQRGSSRAGAPKKDPRTRGTARRATEAEKRQARIAAHYKTLGVRPGTAADEVKRAYRALMREHHPDRHAGDPAKQKAASGRAAEITIAWSELEVILVKKK